MRQSIPGDYPRPQFYRPDWLSLDGEWQFQLDLSNSGLERGLPGREPLEGVIRVPFCPESRLSGVGYTDFIPACWYRRRFALPEEWAGKRVLLHFGAVYYRCRVWINGAEAGSHEGGHASFTLDITALARPGENTIVVQAESDVRDPMQPSGKQSPRYGGFGCFYTRTTGIWQSVWLEAVSDAFVESYRYAADIANCRLLCRFGIRGAGADLTLRLRAEYQGKPAGEMRLRVSGDAARCALPLNALHLWEAGKGRLYALYIELWDGEMPVDCVQSYFGMREVAAKDGKFLLNGAPLFMRLVLDQGFNPEGVLTPPDDDFRRDDILRAMALGFNGARLHQKVFDARTLYWADRCGYLLWGEYPNWGLDLEREAALTRFTPEWLEVLARDSSAPSIVAWCPINESETRSSMAVERAIYRLTRAVDPTRPVLDASGWTHSGETDIWDYHDYEQDPAVFAEHARAYASAAPGEPFPHVPGTYPYVNRKAPRLISHGQPVLVSEFGGIGWTGASDDAWGYGVNPRTPEEFIDRMGGLFRVLNTTPGFCGLCYTQLTDVEQEQNGLYTYDRQPKFPIATLRDRVLEGVPEDRRPGPAEIFEI